MFEEKRAALKSVLKSKDPRVKSTGKGLVHDVATGITHLSGGDKLADYMGSKLAKKRVPASQKKYVPDQTTGRQAAKSAASVAGTAALATGGLLLRGTLGATRQGKVAKGAMRSMNASHFVDRLSGKKK